MWLVLSRIGAIAFTGLAIKIVDDALDGELDRLQGRISLTAGLGDGSSSYTGILLVLAALLSPVDSISLFAAAYIWGMVRSPRVILPWGARAWQESLLVALAVGAGLGMRPLLGALVLMVAVQGLDDLIDDNPYCIPKWLRWERGALILALLVFALYMDGLKTLAVLATAGAVWGAEILMPGKGGGDKT